MRKTTVAIAGLCVVLVVTNLAWAYALVDSGVSYSYLNDSYTRARTTALQTLDLLRESADPHATRDSLVAAARRAAPANDMFEKDGFVWIGEVGLKFDASGKLIDARSASEPF